MKTAKLLICGVILIASSVAVYSQSRNVVWDQTAGVLLEAQTYTYRHYIDGATTGTILNGVSCVGSSSPFQCSAPLPTLSNGWHTIQLTASNLDGESAKSPLTGFGVGVPGAPTNVRIITTPLDE